MGVLYRKGCNIVIKLTAIFPLLKTMSCTVSSINTDGFAVDSYYAWQYNDYFIKSIGHTSLVVHCK